MKAKRKAKVKEADNGSYTENMVNSWDVVICHKCNKKISMLNAKLVDEKYFVCKGH